MAGQNEQRHMTPWKAGRNALLLKIEMKTAEDKLGAPNKREIASIILTISS